jgi:hypothetical protein
MRNVVPSIHSSIHFSLLVPESSYFDFPNAIVRTYSSRAGAGTNCDWADVRHGRKKVLKSFALRSLICEEMSKISGPSFILILVWSRVSTHSFQESSLSTKHYPYTTPFPSDDKCFFGIRIREETPICPIPLMEVGAGARGGGNEEMNEFQSIPAHFLFPALHFLPNPNQTVLRAYLMEFPPLRRRRWVDALREREREERGGRQIKK